MADDDNPRFEESDLATIIAGEIRSSQAYDASDYSDSRVLALEYMRGDMPDLPARPNGSRQTSRDVSDTIGWMLPGVVAVFTASDQMVRYELVQEGQEEWSEDATEYTNYTFMSENAGQAILYDCTYDAMVMGNAVPSSYWEPETKEIKTLKDQSIEQIAMLMEDPNVKVLTQKGIGEGQLIEVPGQPVMGPDGQPMPSPPMQMEVFQSYSVKIERTTPGKICDEACKPENLFINDTATDIDTARFVAYLYDDKTRSDLIEMGFDPDIVNELPANGSPLNTTVGDARFSSAAIDTQSPVRSMDRIDLYRCFPHVDVDDDGIAERLEVWFAGAPGGGEVLDWEVWEGDVPYTDIKCYPVPHRYRAESVFDRTCDIARVKTILLRQALDNTYATGLPSREVDLGSVLNPDILVNPKFNGIIWKKPGSQQIRPQEIAYTADKSLVAMQYMDELITKRTGVSRSTMALDPEALQNQTATASQQMRDAGYSQVELVARNMAEGWRKFFKKRLRIAIENGQVRKIPAPKKPEKFREVDPSKWDKNMAVTINTGLGTGSRDRDMAMLNTMMNGQIGMADRLAMVSPAKAIEFIPKIRTTAVRLAESAGIKNPESYYPDITDEDVQKMQQQAEQAAQQGDPKVAADQAAQKATLDLAQQKAMADIELTKARNEGAAQIAAAKAQAEADLAREKATAAVHIEAAKSEQMYRIKVSEIQAELELRKHQTDAEIALKERQMTAELALKERLAEKYPPNAKTNGAGTSSVHVGGEPG